MESATTASTFEISKGILDHQGKSNITITTSKAVIFRGLVDDNLRHYFDLFIMGIGCACIAFTGIITNVINIIVFYRQGLKDSITLSLLSLSVSDLGANIFTFLMGCSMTAQETGFLSPTIDWSVIMYVCFAWERAACLDISMLTTVYISLERCLSVTVPFKVKGMFTVSRTKKILPCIYIIIISCYIPVFATQAVAWYPDEETNSTRLSFSFGQDRAKIEAVSNIMNGICLPTVSYITVVICTCCMIRGLRVSSSFRSQFVASEHGHNAGSLEKTLSPDKDGDREKAKAATKGQNVSLSVKERKVVKLTISIACVFIACTMPQVLMVYGRRFMSELNVGGRYENIHFVFFGFVFSFGGVNASINMFIYLTASSKYKVACSQVFCNRNSRSKSSQNTIKFTANSKSVSIDVS